MSEQKTFSFDITLEELEELAKNGKQSALYFLLKKGAGVLITEESRILEYAFGAGFSPNALVYIKSLGANAFGNVNLNKCLLSEVSKREESAWRIIQYAKSIQW